MTVTSSPSCRSAWTDSPRWSSAAATTSARDALQPNRGWTDDEWESSAATLTDRGLLGPDGRITTEGRARLDRAETLTDELAQEPWTIAGPDVAARFVELAEPLSRAARTALPPVNPIGLPRT